MKKAIVAALLLLLVTPSFSQQLDSAQYASPQVDYLKKSRTKKLTAWTLAGVGMGGLFITLISEGVEVEGRGFWGTISGQEVERPNYTSYYLSSFALVGASVPFFISASRNKKLAQKASASIKIENAPSLQASAVKKTMYPSVAFRVPL